MKQILVVGGGETFDSYQDYLSFLKKMIVDPAYIERKAWKSRLQKHLGPDIHVIRPVMPSYQNAKYAEWEIIFKKYIACLKDDAVLVGHSLGGLFLLMYMERHSLPITVKATFLVSAPYNVLEKGVGMADFFLKKNFKNIIKQAGVIYILQSKDDTIVDYDDALKYKAAFPLANLIMFQDRGHFVFEEKFPELVRELKKLFKKA